MGQEKEEEQAGQKTGDWQGCARADDDGTADVAGELEENIQRVYGDIFDWLDRRVSSAAK